MNDIVACLGVACAASIALLFALRNWLPEERPWLWGALIAHLVAAVAQVEIVRRFYGFGDIIGYYRAGVMVAELWREFPQDTTEQLLRLVLHRTDVYLPVPVMLYGSGGVMIAFTTALMLLVHDSLYAGCMVVAVLAFGGKLALYRVVRRELLGIPRWRLLVAALCIPSVVFWSSGILKESVAMAGLGCAVYGGYSLATRRHQWMGAVFLLIGAVVAAMVKPYLLIPFGISAGVWIYLDGPRPAELRRPRAIRFWGVLAGVAVATGIMLGVGQFFPRFAPASLAQEVGRMQGLGEVTAGGSDYSIGDPWESTVTGQLANVPAALGTALFRPFPFEVRNAAMAVSALETSVLTLLLLFALWRARIVGTLRILQHSPVLAFCAVYGIGLAAGIGLGTTNLGTLSRYRTPMMPFYAIVIVSVFGRGRTSRAA